MTEKHRDKEEGFMKKAIVLCLGLIVVLFVAACGGTDTSSSTTAATGTPETTAVTTPETTTVTSPPVGGTIMLLSNQSAGPQYDFNVAYLAMCCEKLGYKSTVVFGDTFNDPNANLESVKNGMTDDVVGLIMMQDGGVINIMQEFPDLYVAGFCCDLASVYSEGGASAEAKNLDHFLGAIADGRVSGVDTGADMFSLVQEKGYKKLATVAFPAFAYPQLVAADAAFRGLVADYNATAAEADKIEVRGECEILQFQPLGDAYFLEPSHQDLDAIVGFCAGVMFIYPTMKNAIDAGTISADTKLITGGFDTDESILADVGGDGVIQAIYASAPEALIYPVALIDNAIQGKQYPDFTPAVVDAPLFIMDSTEDVQNVIDFTGIKAADMSKLQLPWEKMQTYFVRFNPSATYSDLMDLMKSDALTVDGIGK
jgi:hypothetical protein